MDPNSGRILSDAQLAEYRLRDPEDAAKFSVRLEGTREEIEQVAQAVRDGIGAQERAKRRAKAKAARKARRAGR
ncbi:MAG: hypothetical protein ACJ72O_14675 [Marmoricola sp.]